MIDLNTLTDADRGRMVKVTEEELGATEEVVLVNWNERFLFVAWPNVSPTSGGHIDPALCTFTDRRATIAYRYGLQFRPLQLGAQPRGFIVDPSLLNKTPDWNNPLTRHGALDYPEKLDDAEVKAYELNYLGPVWRLP